MTVRVRQGADASQCAALAGGSATGVASHASCGVIRLFASRNASDSFAEGPTDEGAADLRSSIASHRFRRDGEMPNSMIKALRPSTRASLEHRGRCFRAWSVKIGTDRT